MSHEPLIAEDVIARQPPEAQLITRLLLAKIAELEARLHQSPHHCSLPPSSEHPHATPASSTAKSKLKPEQVCDCHRPATTPSSRHVRRVPNGAQGLSTSRLSLADSTLPRV